MGVTVELLIDLWNFAPGIRLKLVLLTLPALMGLLVWCYIKMSNARSAAAKDGKVDADTYKVLGSEPAELGVFTRLLANQTELPPVFMILILAYALIGIENWLTVLLAWLFVFLRWRHATIMVGENVVLKRARIFTLSVQVFLLLVVKFTFLLIFFAEL